MYALGPRDFSTASRKAWTSGRFLERRFRDESDADFAIWRNVYAKWLIVKYSQAPLALNGAWLMATLRDFIFVIAMVHGRPHSWCRPECPPPITRPN